VYPDKRPGFGAKLDMAPYFGIHAFDPQWRSIEKSERKRARTTFSEITAAHKRRMIARHKQDWRNLRARCCASDTTSSTVR